MIVELKFPAGIDQVSAETSLAPGTARRLVNFDVHDGGAGVDGSIARDGSINDSTHSGGRLSRRSQVKLAIAGARTHSLWSGEETYYVVAGDLRRINADLSTTLVRAGVGESGMSYVTIAGVTHYSNDSITGTITDGVDGPWGVPTPAAPAAVPISTGGLAAGTYMVAYTRMDPNGLESGASPVVAVQVAEGGGIALTSIATSYVSRAYVSPANGEKLYWAHNILAGQTVSYVGAHSPGKMLTTQFLQAPSPMALLEYYNGRIYGVEGNTLLYTQAMDYSLTRPATDYIMFPSPILMLVAVEDGLYVGDKNGVIFLSGGEAPQFVQSTADRLAPVSGSATWVDGGAQGEGPVWLTRRGWVFGGDGGQVKRLTEGTMALPHYNRAAGLYREHDGMRQLMAFVAGEGERTGASDSYSTEIVRNGRII